MILESQTARELAAKSHEARRRNKELRELAEREPQPEPQVAPNPLADILTRTREHIEALDSQMEDCVDPKDWDCLTRSREREWRIFAHLSNLPGPGNLKPSSKPNQQRPRTIEPTSMPTPQPAQDNAPQGSVAQAKGVPGDGG